MERVGPAGRGVWKFNVIFERKPGKDGNHFDKRRIVGIEAEIFFVKISIACRNVGYLVISTGVNYGFKKKNRTKDEEDKYDYVFGM